jgi:NAD(P)-dependent dehydrogenase (short-subunit alcohol dehydrogenase family)
MKISFEDKVALVTGAASGLGLATAKAFAEEGASVVLADWNEKEVQVATGSLAENGHKVLAVHCDVSDDAQVEAMVKQTVAAFGRLDAAYNNAGVQMSSPKRLILRVMTTTASWLSTCAECGAA